MVLLHNHPGQSLGHLGWFLFISFEDLPHLVLIRCFFNPFSRKEVKSLVDQTIIHVVCLGVANQKSSLHWTILLLFYAIFLHWSIVTQVTKKSLSLPLSPKFSHFKCSNYYFVCSNTMFLRISHSHLQTVFSSFIFTKIFMHNSTSSIGRIIYIGS